MSTIYRYLDVLSVEKCIDNINDFIKKTHIYHNVRYVIFFTLLCIVKTKHYIMKKSSNGSLHLTPSESCTLCALAARLYVHSSILTPAELDIVKLIMCTYLNGKK